MEVTVTTYKELKRWCEAYANGAFGLFFLIGHQGQAKSTYIRKLVEETQKKTKEGRSKPAAPERPPHKNHIAEPLWIEGGAVSAFKLYQSLYFHLNELVVMDDVDAVYSDRTLIRLLKCLCQTEDEKTVGWHTDSKQLEGLEVPLRFQTKSRVCIIANRWKTLSEHVGSFKDRGWMVHFKPSPQEVWNYAKAEKVCADAEVTQFVKDHLWMIDQLSLRTFTLAAQAKKAKLEWKDATLESLGIRDECVVASLEKRNFPTTEARVSEFMKITKQSRPMYFKAAARLRELQDRKHGDTRGVPRKPQTVGFMA